MAKDPAVLFYTSDFLTGTRFMSYDQIGRYITLLCMQQQQGHISEEDMMQICGENGGKILKKFVQDEGGNYFNKRMEKEIIRRRTWTNSRRKNLESGKNEPHMGGHMENEDETVNENINRNKKVPTLEEVKAYVKEINSTVDPQEFYDKCSPKWDKITDWKAYLKAWKVDKKKDKKSWERPTENYDHLAVDLFKDEKKENYDHLIFKPFADEEGEEK